MRLREVFVMVVAVLLSVVGVGRSEAKVQPTSHLIMATVTYETGFDFEDYNSIREQYPVGGGFHRPWGEHPIIWKHIVRPDLDLDPWTVDPNQGPLLFDGVPPLRNVFAGDSASLDNYESSGAFTDAGGNTVDPAGHWVETFTIDGEEVAVLAAMAIWEWSTPVYINFTHDDGVHVTSLVGVIDSVTLSTPSGPPHEVCGWDDPDPSVSCPGLIIESIKMTYYSDLLLCCSDFDYYDGPQVSGADFSNLYESSYGVGPVIYDPPQIGFGDPTPQLLESTSNAQAVGVLLRNSDGTLSKPR